jgi:hypothetical protein
VEYVTRAEFQSQNESVTDEPDLLPGLCRSQRADQGCFAHRLKGVRAAEQAESGRQFPDHKSSSFRSKQSDPSNTFLSVDCADLRICLPGFLTLNRFYDSIRLAVEEGVGSWLAGRFAGTTTMATASTLSLDLSGLQTKVLGGLAALLSDPIKFETGGVDESDQVPYEPINSNVPPPRPAVSVSTSSSGTKTPARISPESPVAGPSSLPKKPTTAPSPPSSASSSAPVAGSIPLTWPQSCRLGPGFTNIGNTCFLNATMQALVHTPPMVTALLGSGIHTPGNCTFWLRFFFMPNLS